MGKASGGTRMKTASRRGVNINVEHSSMGIIERHEIYRDKQGRVIKVSDDGHFSFTKPDGRSNLNIDVSLRKDDTFDITYEREVGKIINETKANTPENLRYIIKLSKEVEDIKKKKKI